MHKLASAFEQEAWRLPAPSVVSLQIRPTMWKIFLLLHYTFIILLCSYVIPNVADEVQTRGNGDVLKVTVCFMRWPDTDHVLGNIRWYVREGGSRWTWLMLHCAVVGLSDISFYSMHVCVVSSTVFISIHLIEVFISMPKTPPVYSLSEYILN